jgi:hypothetical protein
MSASLRRLVQFPIDGRDLLYPAMALEMVHFKHELRRPVEVIGNVGYLLVEFV